MVILDTTIFFENVKLIEKLYPAGKSGEFLDQSYRDDLVQAIGTLVHDRFDDEVHSAKIGDYQISMIEREIEFPGDANIRKPLFMYSICDIKTDVNRLLSCMNEAMDQFLNRFSRNDIFERNIAVFSEFTERLEKIFASLIYSLKDRMKRIF